MTKTKIVNIDMGKSPSRPTSFVKAGEDVAPGQYDDGMRWNSNSKSFKIGEKRSQKIEMTAGPGQYEVDKANSVTQTRVKSAIIPAEKARPETFANKSTIDNVGPGQYDDGVRWNSNAKSFTIGEKRQEKVR